jgi:hypothetical protein
VRHPEPANQPAPVRQVEIHSRKKLFFEFEPKESAAKTKIGGTNQNRRTIIGHLSNPGSNDTGRSAKHTKQCNVNPRRKSSVKKSTAYGQQASLRFRIRVPSS